MKKRLFVIATLVSLYSLFTLGFTTLDNQGQITKILTDAGLSNLADDFETDSIMDVTTMRQPMPKPRLPEDPPPEVSINNSDSPMDIITLRQPMPKPRLPEDPPPAVY